MGGGWAYLGKVILCLVQAALYALKVRFMLSLPLPLTTQLTRCQVGGNLFVDTAEPYELLGDVLLTIGWVLSPLLQAPPPSLQRCALRANSGRHTLSSSTSSKPRQAYAAVIAMMEHSRGVPQTWVMRGWWLMAFVLASVRLQTAVVLIEHVRPLLSPRARSLSLSAGADDAPIVGAGTHVRCAAAGGWWLVVPFVGSRTGGSGTLWSSLCSSRSAGRCAYWAFGSTTHPCCASTSASSSSTLAARQSPPTRPSCPTKMTA
jgi:hypothetical protein